MIVINIAAKTLNPKANSSLRLGDTREPNKPTEAIVRTATSERARQTGEPRATVEQQQRRQYRRHMESQAIAHLAVAAAKACSTTGYYS